MNLLGGLFGNKKAANSPVIGGQGAVKAIYPKYVALTEGDDPFDTAAEVLALMAAAGTYKRIWERTVPAQQEHNFGWGTALVPDTCGFMWLVAADADVGYCEGSFKLVHEDANRWFAKVATEIADSQTHKVMATPITIAGSQLLNRQEAFALPDQSRPDLPRVREDSRLAIDYCLNAAVAGKDIMDFRIPITIRNI